MSEKPQRSPNPPTTEQQAYADLLAGRPIPLRTYGHARHVIDELEDLRNTETLDETGWTEGDVLRWKGNYYRIVRIYGSQFRHRMQLEEVDLEPTNEGDTPAPARVVRRKVATTRRNPFTLRREDAERVDLLAWQP